MPKGIPNKKSAGRVYVAKELFLTNVDGVPTTIPKGTTVREGHQLLAGRDHLFTLLAVQYDVDEPADVPPEPEPEPEPEPKRSFRSAA